MNMIKRTFLYLVRKKGKTLMLFAFLLVIATMMLTCLSLYSAIQNAGANLKKELMGSFTVNAKRLDNGLTENAIDSILALEGLSGQYVLRSYTQAAYYDEAGKPLEIETEGAAEVPQGYEHAGKVVANSDSEKDTYFSEAGFELIEGDFITDKQKNVVLIHKNFAERNGLSVGDTMLLGDVTEWRRRIPVKVAGIFMNTQAQDAIGIAPSYDLYPNIVFTDISTCSYLIYKSESNNSQYGDFYVNAPEELDAIMEKVKEIPDTNWNSTIIQKYDKDYQNAKESLNGLLNLIRVAMIVILVVSFAVLSLVLVFRLRNRIHETGVLLAMGISKRSILSQHLLEVLIIAMFAFIFSFATSSLLAQKVGDVLIEQTTNDSYNVIQLSEDKQDRDTAQNGNTAQLLTEIKVSVLARDYMAVLGVGMMLCFASTALAIIPVLQMKPKNILSQMN